MEWALFKRKCLQDTSLEKQVIHITEHAADIAINQQVKEKSPTKGVNRIIEDYKPAKAKHTFLRCTGKESRQKEA